MQWITALYVLTSLALGALGPLNNSYEYFITVFKIVNVTRELFWDSTPRGGNSLSLRLVS